MTYLAAMRRDWTSNPRADILAGIVVALALIPLVLCALCRRPFASRARCGRMHCRMATS